MPQAAFSYSGGRAASAALNDFSEEAEGYPFHQHHTCRMKDKVSVMQRVVQISGSPAGSHSDP